MVKRSACIRSKCQYSRSRAPALARVPGADSALDLPAAPYRHERAAWLLVAHKLLAICASEAIHLGAGGLARALKLLLEPVGAPTRALDLALERHHPLYAGEVEPELVRELLDALEALDVLLRVEARVLRRALGADEPARLVDAQRLRMHPRELGCYRDHVDAAPAVGRAVAPPRAPSAVAVSAGAVLAVALSVSLSHQVLAASASRRSRGLPFITSASSSTARSCSRLSELGTSMSSRYRMSPRPLPPSRGGPSPRRRWTVPCLVPAGTRIRFVPLSVGTSTVAPRMASTIVIGTSTSRWSPLRRKIGDSDTRVITY